MNQSRHDRDVYKQMLNTHLNSGPNLRLEVISSASLRKGQIITINPLGLCGNYIAERERDSPGSGNDGFTYFGSVSNIPENALGNLPNQNKIFIDTIVVVNDFIIPSRNQEASEQHKGRHFQIWFDPIR